MIVSNCNLINNWTMRGIIFSAILLILLIYTNYKTQQLIPDKKVLASITAVLFFLIMIFWQISFRINSDLLYNPIYKIMAYLGAFAMGIWATFLILSLLTDFIYLIIKISEKITATNLVNENRRELLTRWIPLGIFSASTGMTAIGSVTGLQGPDIKEVSIKVKNLASDLENFKIVQISDLHVGPNIGREYVTKVVSMVNRLDADLIAVTGDLVDGHPDDLAEAVAPLAELKSKHGVYFITGNHEYYWDVDAWLDKCSDLNFIPLLNENRIVEVNSARLLVGGVPDKQGRRFKEEHKQRFDLASKHQGEVDFKLLLAHRPDAYQDASDQGFDLLLSGHTHAGQFFPWSVLVSLVYKFYKGLNKFENLWVYVNAGTGYWGPMNRFLIPSEITVLKLKSGDIGES